MLSVGGLADLGQIVRAVSARFSVVLRPGYHRLKLPGESELQIKISEGTTACASLAISNGERFSVQNFRIEFTRPLQILNPIEALLGLFRHFGGRDVRALLEEAPRSIKDWFDKEAKPAVTVWLEAIEVNGSVGLRPAFSGRISIGSGLSFPFTSIFLPEAILPSVRLAGEPLKGKFDFLSYLRTYLATVKTFDVQLFVEGAFSPLKISAKASDRTEIKVKLWPEPRDFVFGGRIAGHIRDTKVFVKTGHVVFNLPDGREGLSLGVVGELLLSRKSKAQWDIGMKFLKKAPLYQALVGEVESSNPLAKGRVFFRVRAQPEHVSGGLRIKGKGKKLRIDSMELRGRIRLELLEDTCFERDEDKVMVSLEDALFDARCNKRGKTLTLEAEGEARGKVFSQFRLSPLPEMLILDPFLKAALSCTVRLKGGIRKGINTVVTAESSLFAKDFFAELDGRRLTLPQGARFSMRLRPKSLEKAGYWSGVLAWDFGGKSPVLSGLGRTVELASKEGLCGAAEVQVSEAGRVELSGRRGIETIRMLNLLLNPASQAQAMLGSLSTERVLRFISSVLEVFNPELAKRLSEFLGVLNEVRSRLARVGSISDAITPAGMARALSLLLVGDERLVEALRPVADSVLHGKGVRIADLAPIVSEVRGVERYGYEVAGLLRWLDLVLRAGEQLPRAKVVEALPLAVDESYSEARAGFPSAREIAEAAEKPDLPVQAQERIAAVASRMTLSQVAWVLKRVRNRWHPEVVARLEEIYGIKQKVEAIAREGMAGLGHAGRAAAVAALVGRGVGALESLGEGGGQKGVLGPSDVAVLLQAGLSVARQGTQAQINNRLLIEYMRAQGPDFTKEVFIEMAHQVESALASVLFAFLMQDQDRLKESLDLAGFLEGFLEVEVPRLEDYLAGGRRASESYFEALAGVAKKVMAAEAPRLLARKAHIQEIRHPLVGGVCVSKGLEAEARRAIDFADKVGVRAIEGRVRESEAIRAYEDAFEACRELLREAPTAFTLDWFKAFWARNEEALRVLAAVRAYEEDQDEVRRWLWTALGRRGFGGRQEVLEGVVRALWARPEHQERLLQDPLVRLLIPVREGHLEFTIVGCMGVITDGERGHELEDAFRRLEARRGVRVIRAHTGLFRSLEYNAGQVVRAIKAANTPFGLLGYSQGAANALMAEHMLLSGPPEEQKILDGLVCRLFLFSAANGSAHGSSGERKFVRALVEGEKFLKHYQATHSREAARLLLRVLKAALDSPGFLLTVAGAHSLTLERAMALHRDGQFRCDVPTSSVRGIATLERLPDALVYLFHCHEALMPGVEHDSQVATEEAVGRATRVVNAWTEAFARCDMATMPLALHHWAPVTVETKKVTTANDIERAVYQCPKDALVFPWVEVNARFGRIRFRDG